jgi:hypothetical protein
LSWLCHARTQEHSCSKEFLLNGHEQMKQYCPIVPLCASHSWADQTMCVHCSATLL